MPSLAGMHGKTIAAETEEPPRAQPCQSPALSLRHASGVYRLDLQTATGRHESAVSIQRHTPGEKKGAGYSAEHTSSRHIIQTSNGSTPHSHSSSRSGS